MMKRRMAENDFMSVRINTLEHDHKIMKEALEKLSYEHPTSMYRIEMFEVAKEALSKLKVK